MIPEGGADVSTDGSYRGHRRLPRYRRCCTELYTLLLLLGVLSSFGFFYNPDSCFVDTNWINVISKEDGPSFINFIFHRIVFLTHHTGAGG